MARIPIDPADIQANDRGLVFVSGGSNQHTAIVGVNVREARSVVGRWEGVFMGSRIRLSSDQKRLFISSPLSSHSVEAWLLPASLPDPASKEEMLNASPEIPLGGDIFLSPAGDFLLARPGAVVPIRVGGGS